MRKIATKRAISPSSTMFSMQSVSENPSISTFQFLSAASLNLGPIQNGVLGKRVKDHVNQCIQVIF